VSRVAKLAESIKLKAEPLKESLDGEFSKAILEYRFNDALAFILKQVTEVDLIIDNKKPWDLIKNNNIDEAKLVLIDFIKKIRKIALELGPLLPETSEKIKRVFEGPEIKATSPLFPRL
jgi:methionyl-tRNA synthetase